MPRAAEAQRWIRALDTRRCVSAVAIRAVLLLAALWVALRGPWVTWPVAFVAIGILQYHFLVLSHEAQHALIARNRTLNDVIGAGLFGYPFGQPFYSERARHMAHHRLVGDPADPDYHRYVIDDKAPWWPMIGYFVRLATYGKVWEYVSSTLRRPDPQTSSQPSDTRSIKELAVVAVAQLVLLGVFSVLATPWHYVAFWAAPLVVVSAPLSELREFCEHLTTPSSPNILKSFRASWWQTQVLGPVGFTYHAEHHFYPAVPHYHLPKVGQLYEHTTDELEVHTSYLDVLRLCHADRA